jgi:alpha/beta superfamily hydrolase
LRQAFLGAGMGVVSVDLRGTGASFGRHGGPWLQQETTDANEVVDWVRLVRRRCGRLSFFMQHPVLWCAPLAAIGSTDVARGVH